MSKIKQEEQSDGTILYSFEYNGDTYMNSFPKSKPMDEVERLVELTIQSIKRYEQD